MDNYKLRALMVAVKAGSLHKAAEELGYTQPALTSMMASLENEFGFPLLERGRRGVAFSEQGRQLEPYIKSLLNAEKELFDKASSVSDTRVLRIGVMPSIGAYLLIPMVKRFHTEHPGVDIRLFMGTSRQKKWLENNDVDFAIMDETHAEGFETVPVFQDHFLAIVPSWFKPDDTSISLEELSRHPVIFPSADEKNTVSSILKNYPVKEKVAVETDDASILMQMVAQEMGIAFASSLYIDRCPSALHMMDTDPQIFRNICVCAKSLSALSPLANTFIDEFRQSLKSE